MFSLQQFRAMNLKAQLAFLIETRQDLETECRLEYFTYCLFYFNNFYAEIIYDEAGIPVKIYCFTRLKELDKYLNKIDITAIHNILDRAKDKR